MNLTQEYFDEAIKKLATNESVDKLATKDSLSKTEEKLDKVLILAVNNSEDIKSLKTDMSEIKATLNSHTTSLINILQFLMVW